MPGAALGLIDTEGEAVIVLRRRGLLVGLLLREGEDWVVRDWETEMDEQEVGSMVGVPAWEGVVNMKRLGV